MKIQQYNSPHKSSRYNYKPLYICWHIADGSYNGTISWETNKDSKVSSHFVLGKNGEVAQLVPLNMAAWTQGKVDKPTHPYVKSHISTNPNLYCVSIECEGKWAETKGKLTDKQLAAAELTKHIVSEVNRIYGVTIPIDREHMIGHCQINSATRPHCPGELFQYDKLISMAKENNAQTKPQPPQNQNLPYTVQVGVFSEQKNAMVLSKQLTDKGYFVRIVGTGNSDKVCVGKFATAAEAQITCNDLKKKGFDGFVTLA